LDTEAIQRMLEAEATSGCFLQEYSFRPTFQKWKGEICKGFMLHVLDPVAYQPFATTIALLKVILKIHRKDFRWKEPPYEYEYEKKPIDLIIGDTSIRQDLESGASLSHLIENWLVELESFRQWRTPYLRYS